MAAKKTQNKSAFVRSLPSSMPAKEVVAKAKAAGLTLTDKYVATIRYNAKVSARKRGGSATAAGPKRGPGRPRKNAAPVSHVGGGGNGGLVAEIERLVSRIVDERIASVLKAKLGAVFGQ